jgi:PST family polysaccharide transporter
MAAQVPLALLQRRMNYKGLAQSELAGHFSQYGVAVALAWVGAGLTAPLAGWWAQQAVTTLLAFVLAGYRPRFIWRGPLVATMLRQALSYAVSVWIWQMRLLINPLIVARLLGPEAAAAVAVAVRMAEALSFMRIVVWRVSLAALGRLQDQRPLLAAAVSEGMRLQVLAIGSLMLAFSLVAPWLVPFALGHAWGPVVGLFPFLALAYLVNGAFSMHSSALYALGRNVEVAIFHGVHVFMLAVAALLLVPRFGLTGYGMAEAAALCAYLTLHTMTLRLVGEIEARIGLVWLAGLALPLFVTRLGPLAWGGPLLVLALPDTWRALAGWWSQLKDLAHG